MTPQTEILVSARVAELRMAAAELAALCQRPTPVELPRLPCAARRRLLALLMRERTRNAKLLEILHG